LVSEPRSELLGDAAVDGQGPPRRGARCLLPFLGSQIAGGVRAVEGARIGLETDIEMGLGNESCRGLFRRAAGDVKFEMERSLIADRAKEGMNLSASRGAEIGRPEVTEPPTFVRKWPAGRAQVLAGTMSQRKAARDLRIGVATLKRMLDAEASLPTDRPNSGHALEP
jgi:hypothetical protein